MTPRQILTQKRTRFIQPDLISKLHPDFGIVPIKHSKVRHKRIDLTVIIKILYSFRSGPQTMSELIRNSEIRFRKGALSYVRFCHSTGLITKTDKNYYLSGKGQVLLMMFIS